jgi:Protein of unknown function (DUF4058)
MPSPFPGMDPYLENPGLWSEVHSRLIVAISDALDDQLSNRYRIAIEKRVYQTTPDDSLAIGIPDVAVIGQSVSFETASSSATAVAEPMTIEIPMLEEVQERYLEVREVGSGQVVTVLEVLSPKNKRAGEGRQAYLSKRQRILASQTHLVEIDLLRSGEPLPMVGAIASLYRIIVSRSQHRPKAELYPFGLRQPLPTLAVPLLPGDEEPTLAMQTILEQVYRRGRYHQAINYYQPAVPPIPKAEVEWAKTRIEADAQAL